MLKLGLQAVFDIIIIIIIIFIIIITIIIINQSNLFLHSPKSQITAVLRGLHKLHRCDIFCP